MKLTRSLGFLLLGVWLILWGVFSLFSISFSGEGLLMGILAIVAGALVLVGR